MRRMLLAASAASLLGGFALTASPLEAQESEGFQLEIGGFYNALGIVRGQDSPARSLTDAGAGSGQRDKIRRYDFSQYGRFVIEGSQTLDNGMTLGFHTEYEMQDGMANDRAYVFGEGGFGRLQFGTMYSAAYLLHVSPPTAGWGIDDTDHDEAFASINGMGYPASPPYFVNRSMNITYLTPRISGFQAGVTFAPDQQNRENMDNRVATNLSRQTEVGRGGAEIDRDLQNIFGLGINYETSFEELSLAVSAGVETGKWNHGARESLAGDDKRAWSASSGLYLGFGDLEAGVAYNWTNGGMSSFRQHTLTAGLTYTIDRFTFGPSFGNTWERGSNSDDRSIQIYEFGTTYAFAPGVNLVGSLQHARYDNGDLSSRFDGNGTAGLFGVQLSF